MNYKLTYKTILSGETPEDAEEHTRHFKTLEAATTAWHQLDAYTNGGTGLTCFDTKLEEA